LLQGVRGIDAPGGLLAVPNVTAHPSTASVPITVLLYNGPLLCGFNAPIKGLNMPSSEVDKIYHYNLTNFTYIARR